MNNYAGVNMDEINRNGANDILAITIKVKNLTSKDGKKKFKSVKGMMYIRVFVTQADGSYQDKGYKNYWLDLGFTQDAFKNDCFDGCCVKDVNDLSTGVLYVNANYVDAPSVYKVTKDDEGKDVYPKIWVKGGIVGFQKYKPTQSAFTYQPTTSDVVDAVTGEVSEVDEDYEQYTESNEESKED